MRIDHEVERDVIEELAADPDVRGAVLSTTVESGVVHLDGTAPTMAAKVAARRAAERVAGVRAVRDEVDVEPPPALRRSDAELAGCVAMALMLNVRVPSQAVQFSVRDARVTLAGLVPRHADREAAEAAIATLPGVREIINRIEVEPPCPVGRPATHQIETAFRRSAELDCKHIVIEIDSTGAVLMRGMVRSWAEARDAERAAWSAPGVRTVTNRLAVVP